MVKLSSQNNMFSLLLSFLITCNIVVIVCETKVSCNQKDKQILLCFKNGLKSQRSIRHVGHGPTNKIVVIGEEFIVTSMVESQILVSLVPPMMTL